MAFNSRQGFYFKLYRLSLREDSHIDFCATIVNLTFGIKPTPPLSKRHGHVFDIFDEKPDRQSLHLSNYTSGLGPDRPIKSGKAISGSVEEFQELMAFSMPTLVLCQLIVSIAICHCASTFF